MCIESLPYARHRRHIALGIPKNNEEEMHEASKLGIILLLLPTHRGNVKEVFRISEKGITELKNII